MWAWLLAVAMPIGACADGAATDNGGTTGGTTGGGTKEVAAGATPTAGRAASAGPIPVGAGTIRDLTGAATRVVWSQEVGDGFDTFAQGRQLVLAGFDSDDGEGEREILTDVANYSKPLITPGGDRVVFSDRHRGKVFIVSWDGTDLRELAAGFALAVWADPRDGVEWLYLGVDPTGGDTSAYESIWRLQIDRPSVRERIWSATPVGEDNFQLSANGRRAGGMFPWPDTGIADLTNGSWTRIADGCWTALCPDDRSGASSTALRAASTPCCRYRGSSYTPANRNVLANLA